MGCSHLLAYHNKPDYQIIGLVDRNVPNLPAEVEHYKALLLPNLQSALDLHPDVVSINTHTDSHAEYAIAAMESGAHVFVEKPLAPTVEAAEQVVSTAKRTGKKLVIGYILRHHPSWVEFIRQCRLLGPPYVMRLNLNQRSTGAAWEVHRRILSSTSPLIDCGVHYIDVMLQITDSKPVQVRGMGARLANDIPLDAINYGHLQIIFADGSVGWYEAGWGPMMSETASFVKDVIGRQGSVSIVQDVAAESASLENHTKTGNIVIRNVTGDDKTLSMTGEPDHYELCAREQQFLLDAIRDDLDLSKHMDHAVKSLSIALAADKSMRENRHIDL